jgi:hypothetical protein
MGHEGGGRGAGGAGEEGEKEGGRREEGERAEGLHNDALARCVGCVNFAERKEESENGEFGEGKGWGWGRLGRETRRACTSYVRLLFLGYLYASSFRVFVGTQADEITHPGN